MALRDTHHIRFDDNLLGNIETSLSCRPVHFDCFPDLTVCLHDPHIMKALTLSIKTQLSIKNDLIVNQDDDNSKKTPSLSKTNMEQPDHESQDEPYIDHKLLVLKKDFTPNQVALGKELDLEKNRAKREAYKANHTKE